MSKILVSKKKEKQDNNDLVVPGNIVSVEGIPVLVHTDYHPNFRGVVFHKNHLVTEGVFSKCEAKPWEGTITITQDGYHG